MRPLIWGSMWDGLAKWLASRTTDQGVPGSRPGRGTVCCGLEQVTFTHCLVLVKTRKPWTDDFFFYSVKIISLIETSQSVGGAKREYPGKTT